MMKSDLLSPGATSHPQPQGLTNRQAGAIYNRLSQAQPIHEDAPMFPPDLIAEATALLDSFRACNLKLAAAESCTGGLVTALLTEIAGSSDVVERGFVTYSNAAKHELLGVPETMLARHGAVSEPVARAMAEGALAHSEADVSVAITGVAGPGGGTAEKPVGLVHLAAARRGGATLHRECRFGDIGRAAVRLKSPCCARPRTTGPSRPGRGRPSRPPTP
jgi:nicotinamide-nucleotide amidase